MNNPYQNINTATPTDQSRTGIVQVLLITAPGFEEECGQLQSLLAVFEQKYPFILLVLNIGQDKFLRQAYQGKLPCLEIGPFTLSGAINSNTLENALHAAQFRLAASQVLKTQKSRESASKPTRFTIWNRFSLWFSQHHLPIIILFLALLIGFSFLAPILMKLELPAAAQSIYKVYHIFCHQLAFRSIFLFGPQVAYPRQLAGVNGLISFGQATGLSETNFAIASAFIGNPNIGYKLALCQRDLAIQSAILVFTLLFALSHQKIKPVPILIWAVLGFLPIILDGSTQLLSQLGWPALAWLPARESTPLLRVLTGASFGFFSAWYVLPLLHESMQALRLNLEKKALLFVQHQPKKAAA